MSLCSQDCTLESLQANREVSKERVMMLMVFSVWYSTNDIFYGGIVSKGIITFQMRGS